MTTTDLYIETTGSDSNSGTQSSPFKTILKASQAAQPGTTVHVAAGSYPGGFETAASGSAPGPIHYVSDTKWGAMIVAGANSRDTAWDNRGAHVIIDGFQVDGSHAAAWVQGIYSAGSYSVIENSNVHNIAQHASTSASGGGVTADGYYWGRHIDAIGNVVHDIGPTGGQLIQGIYEATSGNVENNLVYNVSGYGIHLWHDANNVNIVNNTAFTNQTGGILCGGADYLKGSNTSSTILYGGDGQDHLVGHNAPTEFIGGYGRDFLWGGAGKNTFTYLSAADSTLLHPDGIGNFHDSQDVIDLHFLTAADNPGAPNHRPLSFIGSNAFTGAGNQVHVTQNVAKNETDVEADLRG